MAKSLITTDRWVKAQSVIRVLIIFNLFVLFATLVPHKVFSALEPHEVVVIANNSAADSVTLAKYYMAKRGIPASNLIKLRVVDKESCSREDYDRQVMLPIRGWLKKHHEDGGRQIRCLLMMYGMPLKVLPTAMSQKEKKRYKNLKKEKAEVAASLLEVTKGDESHQALKLQSKRINKELGAVGHHSELAALDSEIALVDAGDYSLEGWQLNPSFLAYRGREMEDMVPIAYMVARLDGPNSQIVKRIIDDSLYAEKKGLTGKAYFDAKGPRPRQDKIAEKYYDYSLYIAADQVESSGVMSSVTNSEYELFQPGECPDAALYSGWYRRGDYYDAFDWQPGAVGYHIASSECGTLKSAKSKGWCLGMLRDGVAAVIGPISEPYLQAFPPPAMFFSLLVDGRYSLAEAFAQSVPFRSWRMVLIGDPLYRPFKNSTRKGK